MKKISEFIEKFNINFRIQERIVLIIVIVVVVVGAILGGIFGARSSETQSNEPDNNVYLGEEVCYAGDIYLTVVGLNVATNSSNDDQYDDDGDKLSAYTLNLKLSVEYRPDEKSSKEGKSAILKSEHFSLKETNLENKGAMKLFFENLATATLSAMLDGAIEGGINIIESTASFALDYTSSVIEEVSTTNSKLKPIKATKNQFEPFRPSENEGKTYIELSFAMKENYLDSNKTIVLAIDAWNHVEKHIFLIIRPQNT